MEDETYVEPVEDGRERGRIEAPDDRRHRRSMEARLVEHRRGREEAIEERRDGGLRGDPRDTIDEIDL